jgi:cyclopropane-fatty-acyl-phospholipid synthase
MTETVNETRTHNGGKVSGLERAALRRVLAMLGDPPIEFVLWNGEVISAGHGTPVARVRIRHRSLLLRLLYRPDLYFGEAYTQGDIEVEGDLVKLLEYADPLDQHGARRRLWERVKLRYPQLGAHTLADARENIHHHYDIGNDFYRLWLDPELVYTCAYFPTKTASLEEAQQAKMEYVCRKLRLQPGESVVEAGCGWGALARYMARHYGVKVRAYNISHEQIIYAREQTREEGLDGQVEFIEEDYRAIKGRYDAFVSVGMLEHVGKANYGELGTVIERCLSPRGRGLLHSIGRDRPMPMNAWIERHIFPGAYPPTLQEMLEVLEPGGFSVLDVENLRLHYARTLEHWLSRYEQSADAVRLMFDERFVRTWRLYLAGSIAAFLTGCLQLFQLTFVRSGVNELAWTRRDLYEKRLPGELD